MTKNKKIFIKTFGCQMNVHDSEIISGVLEKEGYSFVDSYKEADIVILNTCAVRGSAENKVSGFLGVLGKKKKLKKADLIIVVCGCVAQDKKQQLVKRFPYIDILVGTKDIEKLPIMLQTVLQPVIPAKTKIHKKQIQVNGKDYFEPGADLIKRDVSYKAWVSIIKGCSNFCSYCIVPYVRGPEVSRPNSEILDEVKKLADAGVKEICLLGQNVNSYQDGEKIVVVNEGKQSQTPVIPAKAGIQENEIITSLNASYSNKGSFVDLLYDIDKLNCISRVKFVTSHPKDISMDLLYAMRDLDSLCEFLHFPCQSGSNKILNLMNRGYTREKYIETVLKAREIVPNITIGTDIVVGFPGEDEKDFNDTVDLVDLLKFDFAYVFKYSKREGTKAYDMKDNISEDIIKQRHAVILELQNENCFLSNKADIGKVKEVLIEKNNYGRTRGNKIVDIDDSADLEGKIVNVKIIDVTPHALKGLVV
jgi:tRNA-2-methylthio-N6-dimethylallyladenosine synthase